jgi:BlaI family penicillinase repressor
MKVANSELSVLQVLWHQQPLTIGQIISRIQQQTDWHENTIKTLVSRLHKKGLVTRVKDGRQFFYSPAIEEHQVIQEASSGFLQRFFDGKLSPLIAHFADQQQISADDIKEIEAILERMKNND